MHKLKHKQTAALTHMHALTKAQVTKNGKWQQQKQTHLHHKILKEKAITHVCVCECVFWDMCGFVVSLLSSASCYFNVKALLTPK